MIILKRFNPIVLFLSIRRAIYLNKLKSKNLQKKLLLKIIKKNRNTRFGIKHHFANIDDIDSFQKNVPIQKYSDFEHYVNLEKSGVAHSIVNDEVKFFSVTSGTTDHPKFIPITEEHLTKIKNQWSAWIADTYIEHPDALGINGSILTFNSASYDGFTAFDIPYGSISGILHDIQPWYIASLYSVPNELFAISDFKLRYYLIGLFSISKDVRFIITPNASTLMIFSKFLSENIDQIINDYENDDIHLLQDYVYISNYIKETITDDFKAIKNKKKIVEKLKILKKKHNVVTPGHIFQNLKVIGCWTSGSVGIYAKKLEKYFGNVYIKDLGLMASEGRFSIPIEKISKNDGILDVSASFYEFIEIADYEENKKKTVLASQVELNKKYYMIITNENGLYRYFLDDIVTVTGFYEAIPIIKFMQKGKYFSSMTGEKVSEWEVVHAFISLQHFFKFEYSTFFVKGNSDSDIPHYELYIEYHDHNKKELAEMEAMFDMQLKKLNIEYESRRESFRLDEPKIKILEKNTLSKLRAAYGKKHESQTKIPKLLVLEKDIDIFRKLDLI